MGVLSLGQEDPLEKDMESLSRILVWEIPWTEKPGGLQSMGWQRMEYNLATKRHTRLERFLCGSAVKNPPAKAGDTGLIPGLGRYPREENINPLQYSCLGNPMDREAWWATVNGAAKCLHTWDEEG